MPIAIFGGDLKRLIPVGNLYLVAGKNIPEVSQNYVLSTYHTMFFWKIKNLGFDLLGVKLIPWPQRIYQVLQFD